LKTTR